MAYTQARCRLRRALLFSREKSKQKSAEALYNAAGRPSTSGFGANPPLALLQSHA